MKGVPMCACLVTSRSHLTRVLAQVIILFAAATMATAVELSDGTLLMLKYKSPLCNVWAVDRATGSLTPVNSVDCGGFSPIYGYAMACRPGQVVIVKDGA